MANQLYCQLIQAAHPGKMPEELPSFPLLAKAEVDRCRSSTKYQPRVGLRRTRPNQKRTITAGKGSCSKRIKIDDPLSLVQRLHKGRKAIQRKQRKLPPQPRQMAPVSKIIRKAKRYQIRISKTTIQISLLLCATNGLQNMERSRQVKLMWGCLLHLPKCIAFTIIMHVK